MVKFQKIAVVNGVFLCLILGLACGFPTPGQAQDSPAESEPAQVAEPPPSDAPAPSEPPTAAPPPDEAPLEEVSGANADTAAPPPAGTPGADGPTILMPPGEVAPNEPGAGEYGVGIDPLRGMQQARFDRAAKTSIGGYGELHLNLIKTEGDVATGQLDLHRFVLFFAHNFNDRFRLYSELELEHAFVADSGGVAVPGSFQVEQAYVDWRVLKGDSEALYVRAGVVLIPMGIINQWHEPPIFNGVERPLVDRVIIPTTWREGGVGVWGEPIEGLRYEFYVVSGLDASGFSGSSGLRGGRLKVTEAVLSGPAFAGRVEWEPVLGMVVGVAPYFGLAGPNNLDVNVKVSGVAADWRMNRKGFESRAVLAYFHVSNTAELRTIPVGETEPISTVGSDLFGVYGELGYNVISSVDTEMALVPFVRLDYYDTTFEESNPAFNLPAFLVTTVGFSFRPIPQIAFKFDYQALRASFGPNQNRWNVGMGYMF